MFDRLLKIWEEFTSSFSVPAYSLGVFIGAVLTAVVVLPICCFFYYVRKRCRRVTIRSDIGQEPLFRNADYEGLEKGYGGWSKYTSYGV